MDATGSMTGEQQQLIKDLTTGTLIYSSDDITAHDLGDLSMKSVTVMGTNVNLGDDYKTWNLGTCGACNTDTPPKCYGDGNDGVVRFSVSPAWEASLGSAFVSSEGSFYPRTNIALFNSVTGLLDCNHGPETGNDFGPQTAVDQVFEFDLVSLADGSVELNRIPVRVMVPATGTGFGDGFYENTYDSDSVCDIPPDRPNWGTLTWTNLVTPSDSAIEFEIFTADSLAELADQIPTPLVVVDTMANTIDVGDVLLP